MKMKKSISVAVVAIMMVTVFSLGVYASNNWLSFEDKTSESSTHVDEIMDILRQVNTDKITAEQAVKELQDLNPQGLAKQNQELREQIKDLEGYIAHLEKEVTKANNAVESLREETESAVNEARSLVE